MYMYRQEEREREKEITWSSCFFCVCCTEEYLKERYLEVLCMQITQFLIFTESSACAQATCFFYVHKPRVFVNPHAFTKIFKP